MKPAAPSTLPVLSDEQIALVERVRARSLDAAALTEAAANLPMPASPAAERVQALLVLAEGAARDVLADVDALSRSLAPPAA